MQQELTRLFKGAAFQPPANRIFPPKGNGDFPTAPPCLASSSGKKDRPRYHQLGRLRFYPLGFDPSSCHFCGSRCISFHHCSRASRRNCQRVPRPLRNAGILFCRSHVRRVVVLIPVSSLSSLKFTTLR